MKPEALQELAQQIACFMGWDWTYQPPENENHQHYARIAGPDGCAVHLGNSNGNGKLDIYGLWPENLSDFQGNHGMFYPQGRPNIGCSASRGPEAIAKDILRRFVPDYLPKWYEQVARRKTTLARMEKERQAIHRLAEAVGKVSPLPLDEPLEGPGTRSDRKAHLNLHSFSADSFWGHADVSAWKGEPEVKMELHHLTLEQALAIAAIVAA